MVVEIVEKAVRGSHVISKWIFWGFNKLIIKTKIAAIIRDFRLTRLSFTPPEAAHRSHVPIPISPPFLRALP